MKVFRGIFALSSFVLTIPFTAAATLGDREVEAAAVRIDGLVEADLAAAGLKPNAVIDDGTFLRRAYMGIIGRIPTEEESRSFFDDTSEGKRVELVDTLVASPGFDSHFFNWAGDLLRLQTKQEQFGLGWHVWLRKSLAEDKPWDVMVREMLGSQGHAATDPAVGYYLRDRNMQLDNFSNTMQVFLGRQIGCAQCHDHPFDDWSQYDYYQMAAFGGGFTYKSEDAQNVIRRVANDVMPPPAKDSSGKKGKYGKNKGNQALQKTLNPVFKDFNKNALYDDPKKFLRLPDDYQYRDAAPKSEVAAETLFGEHLAAIPPAQRREAFAKWVSSPENPFFTKVIANRMWARVFGHGLQEPLDDWSEDITPAHPEVLAFLETTMKEANYDLRAFSRVLFRTELFQRECAPEEAETGTAPLVQGPALRRMTAEQLYDSMLVLARGEIDDAPSGQIDKEWAAYTHKVETLLNMESEKLIEVGESVAQAEKEFQKAQAEVRRLKVAISEAETAEARKQAELAFKNAQKKQFALNKLRNPLAEMDMQMGGGGGGNKNKGSSRASEFPAPFSPGSLVREFGGSDRSIPSSGDTIPTVPQALALLNDYQTDIIKGKGSALGSRLSTVADAEEKLEIVFLRLYACLPTADEKERYLPLTGDRDTFRDFIRAMLTSNRFIFVQ
ncbi:MAG: DUF1549 domain-containing protein [Luteolibacter sp.]